MVVKGLIWCEIVNGGLQWLRQERALGKEAQTDGVALRVTTKKRSPKNWGKIISFGEGEHSQACAGTGSLQDNNDVYNNDNIDTNTYTHVPNILSLVCRIMEPTTLV